MSRCAVLISGHGSNLQALIDAGQRGDLSGDIAVVVSDQATAYGLQRAEQAGIPTRCVSKTGYDSRAAFDRGLADRLAEFQPDLLVLAGFMRVLGPDFVDRFRGRMLNVHPSLLPRHPGLNTYRRVLEAGDDLHGATVHFVTDELDAVASNHANSPHRRVRI